MELTEPQRTLWPDAGSSETAETFQVLGRRAKAQVLLPSRRFKAASRSLIRYHGGMGLSTRIARRGAAILARLGILDLMARERPSIDLGHTDDPNSLRSILSNAVGAKDVVVAIWFGAPRANQKPVLRIMNTEGDTLAYAKIGWNELTRRLVDTEVAALTSESVRALTSVVAPEVMFHGEWGSSRVAIFEAVPNRPGRVEPEPDHFLTIAHCWPTNTRQLRTSSFFTRLVADLTNIEGQHASIARAVAENLDAEYGTMSFSLGGWHGDWTPWNNAKATQGRISLWDWERAGDEAPLGFDSVHYRFQPRSLRRARPLTELLSSSIRQDVSLGDNAPKAIGHLYVATVAARHLQPEAESGPMEQYGAFLGELNAILEGRDASAPIAGEDS